MEEENNGDFLDLNRLSDEDYKDYQEYQDAIRDYENSLAKEAKLKWLKVIDQLNICYFSINSCLIFNDINKTFSRLLKEYNNSYPDSLINEETFNFFERMASEDLKNIENSMEMTKKNSTVILEETKLKNFLEIILSNFIEVCKYFNEDFQKLLSPITDNNLNKNRKKIIDLNEFFQAITFGLSPSEEFITVGVVRLIFLEETKFFEIKIRVTFNDNNELYLEFLLSDVTKLHESELQKNQVKLYSMGLAFLAHEFKNCIASLETLLPNNNKSDFSSFSDSEEEKKNNFLMNLANHLTNLALDIKEFAKMDIDNFFRYKHENNKNITENRISTVEIELIPVLEFCINMFKFKKINENRFNLNINLKLAPDLPKKIVANETKLKQVLINILSNAYKFTSNEITLSSNIINNEDNSVKIVRIIIEDNGVGMSDIEQKNLFDPFKIIERHKKLNKNGSSLGLLITRDILNRMNSKLEFSSVENSGTKFWFDLIGVNSNNSNNNNNTNMCNLLSSPTPKKEGPDHLSNFHFNNCSGLSDSSILDPNLIFTESLANVLKNLNSSNVSLNSNLPFSLAEKPEIKSLKDTEVYEKTHDIIYEDEQAPVYLRNTSEKNFERIHSVLRRISSKNNVGKINY